MLGAENPQQMGSLTGGDATSVWLFYALETMTSTIPSVLERRFRMKLASSTATEDAHPQTQSLMVFAK